MELEPWGIVRQLYPDLVLVVEGQRLMYHQAVLAQHSSLLKDLMLRTGCCKCHGEECRRISDDVVVSLTDVSAAQVQYVMDIIYSGGGSMAGDVEEYKQVLRMLAIDTVVLDEVEVQEGFVFEKQEMAASPISAKAEVKARQAESERKRKKAEESRRKKQEKEKLKRKVEEQPVSKVENSLKRKVEEDAFSKIGNALESPKFRSPAVPNKVLEVKNPGLTMIKMPDRSAMNITQPAEKPVLSMTRVPEMSIEIDDEEVEIIGSEKRADKVEVVERFTCPFPDCSSESRTAQSIKVHLALVHYKKEIQADFPNWRTQKCEQCDRSFGQMTAYYLHMAQHKAYPHMEGGGTSTPAAPPGPPGPITTPTSIWPSASSKSDTKGRPTQVASSARTGKSEEQNRRSFGQTPPTSFSQYRRVSLNSPAAPKMQASPVSGFSVNGSPGLARAHQGSPGLTRVQQTSPGLARAQQSALQAKLQGSPGLASGTQGSPGDKLIRKGTPGEAGNRAGAVGSRKGQHQRR